MTQKTKATSLQGCYVSNIQHSGVTEHFLTILAEEDSSPSMMFKRMDSYLLELGSPSILRMDILGRVNTMGTESLQQKYCYNCSECALNHTQSDAKGECPVGGVYVHAVTGGNIRPVWLGGRLIGNTFEDKHIRYVSMDNLQPDTWLDNKAQTRQLFERMEDSLKRVGMAFDNVVRTWLYLDNILSWYDDFNRARDDFFTTRHVYEGMVPTSTGVGGSNQEGTAIQASVLAAEPISDEVTIQAVPSPLQCPALDYGSSFSRAVEIKTPEVQRLYIAGTASIEQEGPTLHVGDVDKQIAFTMEVIHAILTSRGMDWNDVVRAVAYFKDKKDFGRFKNYCEANDLVDLPAGFTQLDVCRDDLLFELEADAVKII